jgi:N-terminal acetyltransferase B complex non-catalytic subunit
VAALNCRVKSTDALYQHINVEKVKRYLAIDVAPDEANETREGMRYAAAYFTALPLGKGLPETDLQPADDLALLAVNAYMRAWKLSRAFIKARPQPAFQPNAQVAPRIWKRPSSSWSSPCGEAGSNSRCASSSSASTSCWVRKPRAIMQLADTRSLGAPKLALMHYEVLEPKQIQHDTLSHILLTRASAFSLAAIGDATMLSQVASSVRWYRAGEAEAADACVRTWSTSTFTKVRLPCRVCRHYPFIAEQIEDFNEFRGRLQHSLSKRLLQIEHIRMRLSQAALPAEELAASRDLLEDIAASLGEFWHDNRDFSVLPSFQPAEEMPTAQLISLGPMPFVCTTRLERVSH